MLHPGAAGISVYAFPSAGISREIPTRQERGMTHQRYLLALTVFLGVALAATSITLVAAAGDPFLGTFVMNTAKSKADPGPLGQSASVKTEDVGGGKIKTTVDAVAADGTKEHWEATYVRDGKDYPATGNPNFDTVAVTLSDPNTINVTEKKAGKVIATVVGKLSADGKSITSSVNGTNAQGQPVSSTIVSDRQ
jgi:hypothetical protein